MIPAIQKWKSLIWEMQRREANGEGYFVITIERNSVREIKSITYEISTFYEAETFSDLLKVENKQFGTEEYFDINDIFEIKFLKLAD